MIDNGILTQRWLHSHEEDSDDTMVYRPVSYPFPRSRGRAGFDLKEDQLLENIQPGANDAPASVTGTWEVDEQDNLVLRGPTRTQSLPIVDAREDCLILGKQND